MLEVLWDRYKITLEKVEYLGIEILMTFRTCTLDPESLEIGSYVKLLVHRVLSDRYRITQDKLQYQRVEIYMTFYRQILW